MPLYKGIGPDGREYEIEGPEGATQEQIDTEIAYQVGASAPADRTEADEAYLAALFSEGAQEDEAGFLENVFTGLGAGATGIYESAALGIATALEEEDELKVREIIQSTADAIGPEGGDKESITYQVAQGVGSILGLAPAALLGFAAIPVGGAIAMSAGAGEASERAREEGATEEERSTAALKGVGIGATEIIPLGRVFKAFKMPFLQDLIDKVGPEAVRDGGSRIVNAAATGGVEAAQETAAELLQNLTERGYNPNQEIVEGLAGAAGIGGASGAIVDLMVNAFVKKGSKGTAEPSDEAQEVLGLPAPQPKLPGGTGFQPTTLPDGSVANTPEELMEYQRTAQETAVPKLPKPPTEEELFAEGNFEEIARQRAQTESGRAESQPDPAEARLLATEEELRDLASKGDQQAIKQLEGQSVKQLELIRAQQREADTEQKKTEQLARTIQQEAQTEEGDLFPFEKRAGRAGQVKQPEPQRPRYMDQQTEIEGLETIPEAEARAQARQQIEMFSPQRQRGGVRREARLPKAESGVVPQAELRQPQRRLGAQQEIDMPTPEQGELIGPRGGARRQQPRTQLGPQRAAMPRQTGDQQQLPLQTMPQSGAQSDLLEQREATVAKQQELIPMVDLKLEQPKPVQAELFDARARVRKKPQFEAKQPKKLTATDRQNVETEAPEPRIVDDALMDNMGLKKAAPIRKRIAGKNLAMPAEKALVAKELTEHAKLDAVSDQTKFKITKFLEETTDDAQGEMFGPRGSVRTTLTKKQQQPLEERADEQPQETKERGRGTRVQDSQADTTERKPRRSSKPTPPPKQERLEEDQRDTEPTGTREEPEPTPLEETEVEQVTETKAEAPKGRKAQRKAKEETAEAKQEVKEDGRDPEAVAAMEAKAREVIEEPEAPAPAESTTTPKEVKTKDTTKAGSSEKKKVTPQRITMKVATEADQKLRTAQENTAPNVLSARYAVPYRYVGKNVTTDTDKTTVASLLENVADPVEAGKSKKIPKNAARLYFGKKARIEDAIELIAFEMINGGVGKSAYQFTPIDVKQRGKNLEAEDLGIYEDVTSQEDKTFFEGMGNSVEAFEAAQWVNGNMSKEARDLLTKRVEFHANEAAKLEKRQGKKKFDFVKESRKEEAKREKARRDDEKSEARSEKLAEDSVGYKLGEEFAEGVNTTIGDKTSSTLELYQRRGKIEPDPAEGSVTEDIGYLATLVRDGVIIPELPKDAVLASSMPLHPEVATALQDGNLGKALQYIASTTLNTRVRNAAKKLASVVGDTKVEVIENLEEAGNFNPENNTIQLDADTGMNVHTVLHEMAHAATSATLANKAHPMTKQLTKLFEDVKDNLDTAYGSTNLDEFVAEAFSNPEFRMKLAGMSPKGDKFTALQRFTNAVMNFMRKLFGMQTKSIDSALSEADMMIENILAPAPASRDSGKLFMLSKEGPQALRDFASGYGAKATEMAKAVRDTVDTNEYISIARDVLGRGTALFKKGVMMAMPSEALGNIMNSYKVSGMLELHKLFERLEGAMSQTDATLDAELTSLQNWSDKNKDKKATFDKLVHQSTIHHVDPTDPESNYKGDKLVVYKKLKQMLGDVGPEGEQQYINLRDAYERLYDKMKDVIYGRIDNLMGLDEETNQLVPLPDEQKTELRNRIFAQMFDKARIKPYFPLTRKGNYWLKYNMKVTGLDGKTTNEPVVRAFENEAQRRAAIEELKSMPEVERDADGDIKFDIERKPTKFNFDGAPKTSFVGQTMSILKTNKVDKKVQDEFLRLFVETLPESAFAKSLIARQGTEGYMEDSVAAFRLKAYDIGRQANRLEYSRRIRDMMKITEEQINKSSELRDSDLREIFLNEVAERGNFAINPPADALAIAARNANRIAFMGTIGFNLSSAIVNLSQVPLVVLPYMAGKTSYKDATKNIFSASKFFMGAGREHSVMVNGKPTKTKGLISSMDNYYDLNEDGTLSIRKDLDSLGLDADQKKMVQLMKPLVETSAHRGLLNRSLFYDSLGVEDSGKAKNGFDKLSAYSAFFFHTAERFNRQVTLAGTYLNELQRLTDANNKLPANQKRSESEIQQEAVDTALTDTQATNGGAVLSTASRLAQMPIGRVAMMYKGFGVQMYYTQFKTLKEAINADKSLTPEQQKIAFKQIMGIQGSVLLLSGVQGLTIYGMVAGIANMFLGDDEEDFETLTRQALGEPLYKGGLNQLLAAFGADVDVAARVGLSNLIIANSRYDFNPSMEKTIVQTLGGPFYGYGSQVVRGVDEMLDGEFVRGVENVLPAAIRNAFKATFRYSDEGILTRRKDPIMDDIGTPELVAQFFGFAPAEYNLNQERNQVLKGIEKDVMKTRSDLTRRLYIAKRMGDSEEAKDVLEEIREFNKSRFGKSYPLSPDSIYRSLRRHAETSVRMYNGVTLNPKLRRDLQEIGEDFNQTVPWFMRDE